MRVVLQRVTRATVSVDGRTIGEVGPGLVLLVGVAKGDTDADVEYVADKCAYLRVFEDADGKMNRSALDVGAEVLAISQFTLCGDTRKGRRPGFNEAASPEVARPLYERLIDRLRAFGLRVETGQFGARMLVEIWNDGPVTFLIESRGETSAASPRPPAR